MPMTNFVPVAHCEVHTENGIEPAPAQPGERRRASLIAVLACTAFLAVVILFAWWSGIAEASAGGGCGGG